MSLECSKNAPNNFELNLQMDIHALPLLGLLSKPNSGNKFHVHQCQAQIEIWHSPDHLTIIWPSPDPHQTLTYPWLGDFKLHLTYTRNSLMFTWHSPDHLTSIWPSPDPYIISNFQLKKSYVVVGGGGQPITNPISGPSFDFFTFGPELDKNKNN